MSLMLENTGKGSRSCVWRLQGMPQGQAGLARESRTVGSPGGTSFGEVGAPAPRSFLSGMLLSLENQSFSFFSNLSVHWKTAISSLKKQLGKFILMKYNNYHA